jgi:hypothetical protein
MMQAVQHASLKRALGVLGMRPLQSRPLLLSYFCLVRSPQDASGNGRALAWSFRGQKLWF